METLSKIFQQLFSKYGWLLEKICLTARKKQKSRVDQHISRVTETQFPAFTCSHQKWSWQSNKSFSLFSCTGGSYFFLLRAGRTSEKCTENPKYSVWWSALFLEVLPFTVMSQNPIWVWFPLTLCYLTENNCFPETYRLHSKYAQMTKKRYSFASDLV